MAATFQPYNHTMLRFATGLNGLSDVYKFMLLNDSAAFSGAHTTLAEVSNSGAYEVSGNGWPAGGFTLVDFAIAIYDTNGFKVDCSDPSQAISGGNLGPYYKGVIYNDSDTDDPPVAFWDSDVSGGITVPAGVNAGILIPTNGFVQNTVV